MYRKNISGGIKAVILIVLVSSVMTLIIPEIYCQEDSSSSGVEFLEVNVEPANILVGDNIMIYATIINNSDSLITFQAGCDSPIWLEFLSEHVELALEPACQSLGGVQLEPGQQQKVMGPGGGILYQAVSAGTFETKVIFSYGIGKSFVPSITISKTIVLEINSEKDRTPTPKPITISSELDGMTFSITVMSITAKPTDFTINPNQSMIVNFDGSGEVELTVKKSMMDDITDITSGDHKINFKQVNSTSSSTTIKFTIPEGENSVEIYGNIVSAVPSKSNGEKREISPRKQVSSGINPQDVICSEGFELLFKSTDNSPACVKPSTAEKLIQRGWARE